MTYIPATHFKSPKTLITENTSSQQSSTLANTYITINGSEMTYTPSADATSVIYDISFYAERANNIVFQAFYLDNYVGGTWFEINYRYRKNVGNSGTPSQAYRWFMRFQYVLPAWTGAREHRLRCASNGSNRSILLHQPQLWDGGSSSTTFTNTNLIMYSI